MQHIMKIRPAWSGKKGKGGAIISLPSLVLTEMNTKVGESLSISVEEGKIVMRKIAEVQGSN